MYKPPLKVEKICGHDYTYKCPKCWKKAFVWHIEKEIGYCFVCQTSYNTNSLKRALGIPIEKNYNELLGLDLIFGKAKAAQKEPTSVSSIPSEIRWFLRYEKNLKESCLRHLSWSESENCLIVPLYPKTSGQENLAWMKRSQSQGWSFHQIESPRYKYTKKDFWYTPDLSRKTKPIILVEGPFDCIKIWEETPDFWPVACLGTSLAQTFIDYLIVESLNSGRVRVWLDPDLAGRSGAATVCNFLRYTVGMTPVVVDYDKEPGDCGDQELKDVLDWLLEN